MNMPKFMFDGYGTSVEELDFLEYRERSVIPIAAILRFQRKYDTLADSSGTLFDRVTITS
ncbi:MAG: hypothetical protein OXC63_03355 [Aestuariivita sp.]|nr:hypothetical protein [Aestuariivita sp.]MCY4346099.1 hypothetical protein [Aestuariivita sp.]